MGLIFIDSELPLLQMTKAKVGQGPAQVTPQIKLQRYLLCCLYISENCAAYKAWEPYRKVELRFRRHLFGVSGHMHRPTLILPDSLTCRLRCTACVCHKAPGKLSHCRPNYKISSVLSYSEFTKRIYHLSVHLT